MPKQFEHDVSDSVAAVRAAVGDGEFGGGQIEHFRKGWAMTIFGGRKVHYWKRTSIEHAVSRCGLVVSVQWQDHNGKFHPRLYGGGDFPRCKRCEGQGE